VADGRRGGEIARCLSVMVTRAGSARAPFPNLRHTFVTRLVQAGVDLYKVQRLLGHKSPRMTQRCAHHYQESLRDGVKFWTDGHTVTQT